MPAMSPEPDIPAIFEWSMPAMLGGIRSTPPSVAERFCSLVGSTPRDCGIDMPGMAPLELPDMSIPGIGFDMSIPAMPSFLPPMSPIDDMSMPMSFIVAVGRGRSGGTTATIPARGANVARAIPDRSTASPTSVNALSSVGVTMAS